MLSIAQRVCLLAASVKADVEVHSSAVLMAGVPAPACRQAFMGDDVHTCLTP